MGRRSLKPQLNQIRAWVRQGRTDAWIAHQLDVSVKEIHAFKRENELAPEESGPQNAQAAPGESDEELDLRAEDDALIAAELDDEPASAEDSQSEEAQSGQKRRRRRGRRGGRGRRTSREDQARLEGTFDHGTEGYGVWLDPAVSDEPVYAEHWAGHRPVVVTIEPNRIIIERAVDALDSEQASDAAAGEED